MLWSDGLRLANTLPGKPLIRFRGSDAWRFDGKRYVALSREEVENLLRRHAQHAAHDYYRAAVKGHAEQVETADRRIQELEAQGVASRELEAAKKLRKALVLPKAAPPVTTAIVDNAVDSLRAERAIPTTLPFNTHLGCIGCPQRNWLAVENGILDLDTFTLLPHDPDWFSPVLLPVRYDPAAQEPVRWVSFIDRVTCGDSKIAAVLQEVVGACLDPWCKVQFFAALIGEGNNGKSVFLNALRALLGSENVSAVDLSNQSSGSHRFMSYQLLGKLANVCGDGRYFDADDTSALKKLTGGDLFTFEAKGKQPIEAVNTAKIITAYNELPRLQDRTLGVWRRAVLVPFNWTVPAGEANPKMMQSDYWRDELPGMLRWATAGLQRLRDRGGFDLPQVCVELLNEHRLESNPAQRFLAERIRETGRAEDYVITEGLYPVYQTWCFDGGVKPLAKETFGKEIGRVFPNARSGPKKVKGTTKRVWFGLSVTGVTGGRTKPLPCLGRCKA